MKIPKNILFVLPEFVPETGGGICTFYNSLLENFEDYSGDKVTVVQGSAFDMPNGISKQNNIQVYHLSKEKFEKSKSEFHHLAILPELQNHVASAWALNELALSLEINFDVVIATDWGLGFIPWIIQGQLPVIIHLHGSIGQIDYYDPRKGLEFWSKLYLETEINFFNYADALATFSNQNITFWVNRNIDTKKFSLIYPVIKNENITLAEQKQTLHTGLVIGRIQYWKGVIQLCESIELLSKKEQQNLQIYWVGKDTYYYDQQSSMDKFLSKKFPNIWKKIIIPLGTKSHKEIEELYCKVDFTIVPSTWDIFNITAIEHVLHKKPLICSMGAGASDCFVNNSSVLVFNNTAKDLAEKIINLSKKTAEELGEMAEKAFINIEKTFSQQQISIQHMELIQSVIDSHKPKPNQSNRFTLFSPSRNINNLAKPELLNTWPIKEVLFFTIERIRKKALSYFNSVK
ncbi:hypothetical protein QFZ20_003015 [Flavobacterium sp. W4I14]|nr:hypothetical protein [Flavobacterium sp. W4I14]